MISCIELKNFLSAGDIVIEDALNKAATVGITGSYEGMGGYSNGAGKSTIAESIRFAITGKHRYKTDASVIRHGASECWVAVELRFEDEVVNVKRVLRMKRNGLGTTSTAVVRFNSDIVASSTKEANSWLEGYFGVTADDFMNSFYFKQKDYDTLLKDRSGKRLSFLERFFNVTVFDRAKVLARKKLGDRKSKIGVVEGKLETVKEMATTSDMESLKSSLEDELEEKESLRCRRKYLLDQAKKVEKSIRSLRGELAVYEVNRGSLSDVEMSIKECNARVASLSKLVSSLKSKGALVRRWIADAKKEVPVKSDCVFEEETTLQELLAEQTEKAADIGALCQRKKTLLENLESVQGNTCGVCGQSVDGKKLSARINKDISAVDASLAEIEDCRKRLAFKIRNLQKEKEAARKKAEDRKLKRSKIKMECEKLNSIKENINEKKKDSSSVKDKLALLEKKKSELSSLIQKDNSLGKKLASLTEKHESLQWEVDACGSSIERCAATISELQTNIDTALSYQAQIKRLVLSRKKLTNEINTLSRLGELFDKCRMSALLVGFEELQIHSNNILGEVGALQKEIVFETQKETQSGTVVDSLDIYFIDQKGKRPVEGLSGGEWDLVSFSIRAALSRYKLCRMNSKIDFLILDEVFGALDENSRTELISVINLFKGDFAQTFVISHTDLKDMFDYNIRVEMGRDGITRLIK